MYRRLSDVIQRKQWSEVRSQTTAVVEICADKQPAAAEYLLTNWFCPECVMQWPAAARRFRHSAHDTNLPVEEFHAILKHYYFKVMMLYFYRTVYTQHACVLHYHKACFAASNTWTVCRE